LTEKYSLASKLRTMLDKAIEDIDLALKIINGGPCRVASSRAYYATFYAMEAALLSKGLLRSKHGGVISAFNQYFIKTGILPSHFGALISNFSAAETSQTTNSNPQSTNLKLRGTFRLHRRSLARSRSI